MDVIKNKSGNVTGIVAHFELRSMRLDKVEFGVVPDIEVALNRDALLKGRDPQLEAAIKYIEEKSRTRID